MLVVDRTQKNGTVTIEVDAPFMVQLPENPTTGYRWHLQPPDDSVVTLLEDGFEASKGGLGIGGMRRWKLQATHAGTTRLETRLSRSGDGQSVDLFTVTIAVQARRTP